MTAQETTDTRLFVLQRAIAALIVTHPNPAAFAAAFAVATGLQQLDQIAFAKGRADVRAESLAFAQELAQLAADECERRAVQKQPPN